MSVGLTGEGWRERGMEEVRLHATRCWWSGINGWRRKISSDQWQVETRALLSENIIIAIITLTIDRSNTPTHNRRHRHHKMDRRSKKAAEIKAEQLQTESQQARFLLSISASLTCSLESAGHSFFSIFFSFALSSVLAHQMILPSPTQCLRKSCWHHQKQTMQSADTQTFFFYFGVESIEIELFQFESDEIVLLTWRLIRMMGLLSCGLHKIPQNQSYWVSVSVFNTFKVSFRSECNFYHVGFQSDFIWLVKWEWLNI